MGSVIHDLAFLLRSFLRIVEALYQGFPFGGSGSCFRITNPSPTNIHRAWTLSGNGRDFGASSKPLGIPLMPSNTTISSTTNWKRSSPGSETSKPCNRCGASTGFPTSPPQSGTQATVTNGNGMKRPTRSWSSCSRANCSGATTLGCMVRWICGSGEASGMPSGTWLSWSGTGNGSCQAFPLVKSLSQAA